MLNEFVFTPSVFDESAHKDKSAWRDQIRTLRAEMFPRTSAWAFIVADLCDGAWYHEANQLVQSMSESPMKSECMRLIEKIKTILVQRESTGQWPGNEKDWCFQGINSNDSEPIDRIITDASTAEQCSGEKCIVYSLQDVEEGGFWRGLSRDGSPQMNIASQIDQIRKIAFHSDWFCYINPYALRSEIVFTTEIVKLLFSFRRNKSHRLLDLHTNLPNVSDDTDVEHAKKSIVANFRSQLKIRQVDYYRIRIWFWPKVLDRILLAGRLAEKSDGTLQSSVRWGVHLGHVATGYGRDDIARTEFKLLGKESVVKWNNDFTSEARLDGLRWMLLEKTD